jgi:hypothetical protein
VNISGVPFKTAKPRLDGRIVGGKPAQIVDHPHQVKLLNCFWIELFLSFIEIYTYTKLINIIIIITLTTINCPLNFENLYPAANSKILSVLKYLKGENHVKNILLLSIGSIIK